MREFRVAGIESAEEQRLVFNKVFEGTATLEAWKWKHYKNPMAKEPRLFGVFDDGKLIAINGFLEMRFRYGDKTFRVLQSCDTATDPDYRKQGVFSNMIRTAQEQFREEGYDALIGFPNFNSYSGFLKIGWQEVTRTSKFFLPANAKKVLMHMKHINLPVLPKLIDAVLWRKIRRWAKKGDMQIKKTKTFTQADYERFLDRSVIYNEMDEAALAWKLRDLSGHYCITFSDKKEGCVLVTDYLCGDGMRRANIVMAAFPDADKTQYKAAMARVLMELRKEYDLLCFWKPTDSMQAEASHELGFLDNMATKQGSPFIINVLTDDPEKRAILSDFSKWNPIQLYTDTVISLNEV